MPAGYEKMRDKFHSQGMSLNAAKGKAARIWNDQHPDDTVTRAHKGMKKAASERLGKK